MLRKWDFNLSKEDNIALDIIHIIDENGYELAEIQFALLTKSEVKVIKPFYLYKIQERANMINMLSIERHLMIYGIDVVFDSIKQSESNYLCVFKLI
jgi:hypothetical protein